MVSGAEYVNGLAIVSILLLAILMIEVSVSNKDASGSIYSRAEEMMNIEVVKFDMGGLCL